MTSPAPSTSPRYRLDNPLAPAAPVGSAGAEAGPYPQAIELGLDLIERPKGGGGPDRVRTQHAKQRMTVFVWISVLSDRETNMSLQNWELHSVGHRLTHG